MAKVPVIDIRPCDLETVREILRRHVPNHEVLAFGSRVKWTARQYSDLDLAIRSDEEIPWETISAIKNELSESRLPMMVDVLDMASVSEKFRGIIEEEYAVVQRASQSGWRNIKLGSICHINPDSRGSDWHHETIKYIDISSVGSGIFKEPPKKIPIEEAPSRAKRLVAKGDTVVSTVRPNRRSFMFLNSPYSDTVASTGFAVLRARRDMADPRFLYYLVTHQEFTDYLVSRTEGSAYPAVNPSVFGDADVCVPPLPEQRKIARILGALDDKIELNRRMNRTLEAMAQAIFKSWFVDFDPVHAKAKNRKPDLPPEIAALFPAQFQDSELGKIPRGWGTGTVTDLCDRIESGGTPLRQTSSYWENGSIPWFKTGELADNPLLKSSERITDNGLKNSACKMWQPGTILIALYAAPTVGRLGILEIPATANQACSALSAKPKYGGQFLFHALLFARDGLQQIAVGSAQQNINQQILREHPVLLPAENVTLAFQKAADAIYRKRAGMSAEIENLSATRDALLPHLLSGRAQNVSAS